MPTLGDTLTEVASRFAQAELAYGHGTDNAWDEAVALVLGVTGLPDDERHLGEALDAAQCNLIAELADRRVRNREPVAYLLGKTRYAGHEFLCEPGVVIPRSPVSQLIATRFRPWLRAEPSTVVDVCCGTGCLGILCALAFPAANVTLLDVDAQAVALARRNVEAHGLTGRVQVLGSDLLAGFAGRSVDLIVSNPPYVDAVDMAALPAEYRHEPRLGLFGGPDGLEVVVRLMSQASRCLPANGLFVCEVGGSMAALARRFPRLPFTWPDLPRGGEGVFILEGRDLQEFGPRG